jgi:hypothetical protein
VGIDRGATQGKPVKTLRRWARLVTSGLLAWFYTAFVLQSLWNWFVAARLNIVQISYWQMFGFSMLLKPVFSMVSGRSSIADERCRDRMMTLLYTCVSIDRVEALKKENEDARMFDAWAEALLMIGQNTLVLLVGWAVHRFWV